MPVLLRTTARISVGCARRDPDGQRQGVHRPVRHDHRGGPVRPHLPGERHPPPVDRAAVADHDRQGGAVPQALRREFLNGTAFASIDDAQVGIDGWVREYNFERPHQSLGMAVPWDRFRLAQPDRVELDNTVAREPAASDASGATRRVGATGLISFAGARYRAGVWLAGEAVTIGCDGGLVHLQHRGVLIATHARRHPVDKEAAGLRRGQRPMKRPSATAPSVTRKVDSSGNVCFAGTNYRVGSKFRRRQVQVAVVGDTLEISIGEELIRTHPVRHDRTREHGALANPGGRPRRINAA